MITRRELLISLGALTAVTSVNAPSLFAENLLSERELYEKLLASLAASREAFHEFVRKECDEIRVDGCAPSPRVIFPVGQSSC